jgi:hypothetical protein
MNKEKELYASNLSLKELLRETEDFCYENNLEYDERKIMITTDYGSNIVIIHRKDQNDEK